jgi:hypothetical protein
VHIKKEDMKYADFIHSGLLDTPNGPDREPKAKIQKVDKKGFVKVRLSVPASKKATLKKCAYYLQQGGEHARRIEEITDPITSLGYDDAEEIVRQVMGIKTDPVKEPEQDD